MNIFTQVHYFQKANIKPTGAELVLIQEIGQLINTYENKHGAIIGCVLELKDDLNLQWDGEKFSK
jgi:hypothetical protein